MTMPGFRNKSFYISTYCPPAKHGEYDVVMQTVQLHIKLN